MSLAVGTPFAGARQGPRPAGWWSVLGAFLRRDLAVAVSYRLSFVLGFGQSILSLVMLYFLGRLVGPRLGTVTTHGTYFDFAVIGSTLLAVFSSSLVAVSQRLRTDQATGTLEVLFTMPYRPSLMVLCSAAYQTLYAAAGALVTAVIAVGLGLRLRVSGASALVAVAGFLLALSFFVALGVALAAYVLIFKRGETVTSIAMAAISVLGGVYYPVSLLPGGLRAVADVLPFTWVVTVLRQSLLAADVPIGRLGLLAATDLVTVPLALALFGAALRHAQRRGSLGQY